MNEISSFDVHNLVKEAQFLVNGKLDNIYQLDVKDLYFQIYVKPNRTEGSLGPDEQVHLGDKPKQLLRLVAGKCFYLMSKRPEFSENMQRFCSYLRKYVLNSKIKSIEQIGYERIVKISLETKDSVLEFYVELFGKGNFILVKENKIISVAEEQIWADRTLKSGETYEYPKRDDIKEIFEKQKQKGTIVTMPDLDKEFSKDTYTTKVTSAKEKEMNRIRTIIEKQTEQLNKILNDAESSKRKGELIYENYQELKEITDKLSQSKIKSKEHVKQALKNNKLFKDFDEKEGKITVDVK